MQCRICSALNGHKVFRVKEMMFGTRNEYQYFQCSSCHCLQIVSPERDSEKLYPSDYYSFNNLNKGGLLKAIKQMTIRSSVSAALGLSGFPGSLFSARARNLGALALKGRIRKEDKILDVGCGDGTLVQALSQLGFTDLTGIDPYMQTEINEKNLKLWKKGLVEIMGWFDVIMMHHSFEHVENPFEVLRHVSQLLKDNGLCIIRIPVADSFAFEQYRENWVQLDAPRHIFLHSNKSINILAARAGLKVKKIVNDSTEFQFIGSEQYRAGIPLRDYRSYLVPFYKKLIFNRKHIFSASQIRSYQRKAAELNREGRGDQRIYYLVKS